MTAKTEAEERLDRNPETKARLEKARAQQDQAVELELEDDPQLAEAVKLAALAPLFQASEELFDAWEKAVEELEKETEPAKWTRKLNRQEIRNAIRGKGDPQPRRSRIRRRVNRIARQKGWY